MKNILLNLVKEIRDFGREIKEFFDSEASENIVTAMLLQNNPIVVMLNDLAQYKANSDGWVSFTQASQILQQQLPEEFAELKKRYGNKLKNIVLAADIFEITEEPTSKGGSRLFYRIKPGLPD
jgi:hypothetical protein